MKYLSRTPLLCAFLCLSLGLFASSPARADGNTDVVRTAQMRLAGLGYYVGHYDGKLGPVTETAIMNFQRDHSLIVTGELTPETYSLLARQEYAANPGNLRYEGNGYYRESYSNGAYRTVSYDSPRWVSDANIAWDDRWHYVQTQDIPSRFAKVSINEDDRGSVRDYMITINGKAVLMANNQPGILRISQTFGLAHEDAVMITAFQGDGVCAYKNYLLTVHRDGTFEAPHEIGNCAGNYDMHVADNALIMNFPNTYLINGWETWDTWRYQDGLLVRS